MASFIKQLLRYDPSSNELRHQVTLHHIIGFNLRNRGAVAISRLSMLLSVVQAFCYVYRVHMVSSKKLGFEYHIAALNVVGAYSFGAIRMIGFGWYYEDFRGILRFMEQRSFQMNDKKAQCIREQHYVNNQKFTIAMLLAGFLTITFFNLTDYRTTHLYDIPFELNFMNPTLKSILNVLFGMYIFVLATYVWIPFITLRVVMYTLCAELKILNNAFADLFETASEHSDVLMSHYQSVCSNSQLKEQIKVDVFWICVRSELRRLVEHHSELLMNIDRICRLAAIPFLAETMGCSIISSIAIFLILKGESLIMVGVAMIFLFECYYASSLVEELQQVHEDMGTVIYALEWPTKLRYDRRNYGHYKHVTKILQIALMRSKSRLRFNCGGLFEMSRGTFTFTVKTCYTLLTFLFQMQAS